VRAAVSGVGAQRGAVCELGVGVERLRMCEQLLLFGEAETVERDVLVRNDGCGLCGDAWTALCVGYHAVFAGPAC